MSAAQKRPAMVGAGHWAKSSVPRGTGTDQTVCSPNFVCQSPSPRDFSSSDGSGRKNPRRSSGVMSLPNNLRKRSEICSWVSMGSRSVSLRPTKFLFTIDQTSPFAVLHYRPMKNMAKKNPVLTVRCPTCSAKPGEKCELATGQTRTNPHFDRRVIAKD